MPLRATSNIIGFDMMLQRNDVAFFINAHLVRFGGGSRQVSDALQVELCSHLGAQPPVLRLPLKPLDLRTSYAMQPPKKCG